MFRRLKKEYRQGIRIRFGLGCYFFQFTIGAWWQFLLRIGNKGYIYNKAKGFFVRIY